LGEKQRRKARAFAKLPAEVPQPHPSDNKPEGEEALIQLVASPYRLQPPIKRFKTTEVQEAISILNPKKSSGYDSSLL
jgi:hypothetical protein